MMQWSVVLADKVDTMVLGYALRDPNPEFLLTVYQNVSKPFLQIRQTGWTLAYLVMPAVVSLAVGGDKGSLERIKYDGTRLLIGLLAPVTLLAGIYASPFLSLWVGPQFAPYAWMLQLFLVATLPLVLSVVVQMAIGMGKIEVVAISNLVGALLNLPLSFYLTRRYGVSGVIWGTVLTTLFSNLLVPGVYLFRVLEIAPRIYLKRTLSAPIAGGVALVAATWVLQAVLPVTYPGTALWSRSLPLVLHLTAGTLAYISGYLLTPVGRADLAELGGKLYKGSRRRSGQ
jgi:O-antigen/teichoic acid export membrane protein